MALDNHRNDGFNAVHDILLIQGLLLYSPGSSFPFPDRHDDRSNWHLDDLLTSILIYSIV